MVLSSLLQRRSCSRINVYGFLKPLRWLSSDSEIEKASQVKKKCVPKEQRAVAAESYVKKYMESNPGLFPKVAHIQNVVDGSWYTVREILNCIKEKMLETTVSTTQYVPDNDIDLHGHYESDLDAGQMQQCEDKDGNIRPSIAMEELECSSDLKVSTSSDAACTNHSSRSSQHDILNLTQCLDQQEIRTSCSLSPNSSADANTISSVPGASGGARRLSSLFAINDDPTGFEDNYGKGDLTVSTSSDAALTHHSCSSSEHDKLDWTQFLDQKQNGVTCSLSPYSSVEMNTSVARGGSQELRNLLNLDEIGDDAVVSESKHIVLEDALNRITDHGNEKITEVNSLNPRKPKHCGNRSLSSSYEDKNSSGNILAASSERVSYTGNKNLMGSKDMKGWNGQASQSIADKAGDIPKPNFFQYLEEAPRPKHQTSRHEIKGLKDCIMGLVGASSIAVPQEKISSWKTDGSCEKSQAGVYSVATLQSFDNKERNASEKHHTGSSRDNHECSSQILPQSLRACVDKISSLDSSELAGESRLSALNDKEESDEVVDDSSKMKLSVKYKAVVKFLEISVQKTDIVQSFKKYGDILKVKISNSGKGDLYTTADVYFKTREGLLNLLADTDVDLRNRIVTVEAAGEYTSKTITVPSLIGDPSVPAAMVKNPTKTVKFRQLTPEISSHDVVAALESKGKRVKEFFFGTKYSVAYVEFDKEDDKEVILAEHSIDVRGKKLLVSRIDVPRTTVIRISFHSSSDINVVVKLCRSLAPIFYIRYRNSNIVDAHFKIGEWPNMLKILNSLNEAVVDGHKLKAQLASVIPPPILQALWRHPEERAHIKKCVKKLLQELENYDETIACPADLPSALLD